MVYGDIYMNYNSITMTNMFYFKSRFLEITKAIGEGVIALYVSTTIDTEIFI